MPLPLRLAPAPAFAEPIDEWRYIALGFVLLLREPPSKTSIPPDDAKAWARIIARELAPHHLGPDHESDHAWLEP